MSSWAEAQALTLLETHVLDGKNFDIEVGNGLFWDVLARAFQAHSTPQKEGIPLGSFTVHSLMLISASPSTQVFLSVSGLSSTTTLLTRAMPTI